MMRVTVLSLIASTSSAVVLTYWVNPDGTTPTTSCTASLTNNIWIERTVSTTCSSPLAGIWDKDCSTGGQLDYCVFSDSSCSTEIFSTVRTASAGFALGTPPMTAGECFVTKNANGAAEIYAIQLQADGYATCNPSVFASFSAGTCTGGRNCDAATSELICADARCMAYLDAIVADPADRPSNTCPSSSASSSSSSSGDDDDPCFPTSATVTRADGKSARMSDLKEGDSILAATMDGVLTTDTVSLLSIVKPEVEATFVTLTTASNSTLTLTPAHHLPVGPSCCSTLKKAADLEVGDKLWNVGTAGAVVSQEVTKLRKVAAKGLHSPVLTRGGFPIVDGIVTSFDSIEKVTLAKHGLAPLLATCKATNTCTQFRELFLGDDKKYI